VQIPSRYADELYFSENKGGMRWYFLTHNYVAVSRFLFQQGRSVTNTIILVGLSILAALVVNPVAAYALSRFRLSYTSKVLLFLLATAAFPAEVTAIPQFLLIKKLGMLNTFSALICLAWSTASGSLCSRAFLMACLKSSTRPPSLKVPARRSSSPDHHAPGRAHPGVDSLWRLNAAYGGYLWNIIVANDTSMWTIMVSLQQYMNGTPANLVMAAMVLASIPTMIAFLMVQRVILKRHRHPHDALSHGLHA